MSVAFLDTCLFIYLIEQHPRYAPIVRRIFADIQTGAVQGLSSVVTLAEVLVIPLRKGNLQLAGE